MKTATFCDRVGSFPGFVLPLLVAFAVSMAACQGRQLPPPTSIGDVRAAYDGGDFATAYRLGRDVAGRENRVDRHEAAYLAGLAAVKLDKPRSAVPLLKQAAGAGAGSWDLVGDAKLQLGLVYGQLNQHDAAATTLLEAARLVTGQKRAEAYFQAAMSQRELGRLEAARVNLILARGLSESETRRREANEALDATGFTLRLSTHDSIEAARVAAGAVAERAEDGGFGSPRVVTLTEGRQDVGRVRYHVQVGRFASHWSAGAARRLLDVPGAVVVPLEE